jgi:hypothetical protein
MKYDFDVENIKELYATGMSTEAIGKTLGVSKIPILRILRSAGVKMRRANEVDDEESCRIKALEAYSSGMTVDEIAKSLCINNKTVSKFLKKAGVVVRCTSDYAGKNGWMVSADLDRKSIVDLYKSGCTIQGIAKQHSVSFGTARRHLLSAGVELRMVSSVPTYTHDSPCAGRIRVRGSWEMFYAKILDIWFNDHRISGWTYEGERIPVNDIGVGRYYLPDFRVVDKNDRVAFHEVKGVLRELGARKIQAARDSGIHIVLIRQRLLYALCRHYKFPVTASKS